MRGVRGAVRVIFYFSFGCKSRGGSGSGEWHSADASVRLGYFIYDTIKQHIKPFYQISLCCGGSVFSFLGKVASEKVRPCVFLRP